MILIFPWEKWGLFQYFPIPIFHTTPAQRGRASTTTMTRTWLHKSVAAYNRAAQNTFNVRANMDAYQTQEDLDHVMTWQESFDWQARVGVRGPVQWDRGLQNSVTQISGCGVSRAALKSQTTHRSRSTSWSAPPKTDSTFLGAELWSIASFIPVYQSESPCLCCLQKSGSYLSTSLSLHVWGHVCVVTRCQVDEGLEAFLRMRAASPDVGTRQPEEQEAVQRHCGCDVPPPTSWFGEQSLENMNPLLENNERAARMTNTRTPQRDHWDSSGHPFLLQTAAFLIALNQAFHRKGTRDPPTICGALNSQCTTHVRPESR